MQNKITIIIVCLFFSLGFSQEPLKLTNSGEISIITSGPGNGLYEKFGHTAIRIKDKELQIDELFNYGIFDFNDSNFYLNFIRGFMKYKLAHYPFHHSLSNANKDSRWVKEQILNLTLEEKNTIFIFLQQNALPENANYFYDPFFDNCATRPRDIIMKTLGDQFVFVDSFSSDKSLRKLMNEKINQNTWGSFGINLALGSKLDKKIKPIDYLYLPEFVFKGLEASKITKNGHQKNIVKTSKVLLDFKSKESKSDLISPLLVFSLILVLSIALTLFDLKRNKRSKWFDFILLFSTGFVGILIVFLWFFTNHSTAPNNFNILWGVPISFFAAFYSLKNNIPKWFNYYIIFLLIALLVIPIIWLSGIQVFNWTTIPLFLTLGLRFLFLQKTLNR